MKILSTPRMERCIGCHSCSLACTRLVHKRLSRGPSGEPFVCIHCGRCVEFCPHDCLEMVEAPASMAVDEGGKEARPYPERLGRKESRGPNTI